MGVRFGTKLSDYALIFVFILLTMAVITDSRILFLQKIEEQTILYDNALDNAVQDAMEEIVELDDGDGVQINREQMLERFFLGLSINLGLSYGDSARERLESFFPVMAVMMEDGIYSWECKENENSKNFSEKIPYCMEKEGYKICYTFGDVVVFHDESEGVERKGVYQEIRKRYPVEEFSDENFDEMRRRAIISTITGIMNEQVEKHNRFAERNGVRYHFSLPVIDMEEWYRTVDDVTLLCIFQGYPYAVPQLGTYHKVVLSGARIHKVQESLEIKEDTGDGKDKLDGKEEFYISGKTYEELERDYFKEIETENIIEE